MATHRHQVRAGVIVSLADVYCYQTSEQDTVATVTPDGDLQPPRTRRMTFPRALKRLRDRLRILDQRLALDTNALRQDVLNLELQKTLLIKKLRDRDARMRERAVAVIGEYFHVFQYGWLLPSHRTGERSPRRQVCRLPPGEESHLVERQRRFLLASVEPRVVKELASHWQALSRGADAPRLTLESIECVGDADHRIVIAKGTLTTLEWASRQSIDTTSAERCVPRNILYPCRVVCDVTASGAISRHEFEMDRVLGLLRELGTLEHVARWLRAPPREGK